MTSYNYITIDYIYIIYIVIILSCSDTMSWVGKRYAPSLHLYNVLHLLSILQPPQPVPAVLQNELGQNHQVKPAPTQLFHYGRLILRCELLVERIIEALGCSVNNFADVSFTLW